MSYLQIMPPQGKKATEPHYQLIITVGYRDIEKSQVLHRFDKDTLEPFYTYKGKKSWCLTKKEQEYFRKLKVTEADGSDLINLETNKLIDAIETLEKAIKCGPKQDPDADWYYETYEHLPGFGNWLYDQLQWHNDETPRIQSWRVIYVDYNGSEHKVKVTIPEEYQKRIDDYAA